jgi:hypothetical protein
VDSKGNPAIDPTKNVLDLVEAAVRRLNDILELSLKRQDDLRKLGDSESRIRVEHIRDILDERTKRLDANELLRAEYEDKLRKAEASRLDAIRIVDTNNVTVANERAAATAAALQKKGDDSALVLSAQVTKSADDVRTLVKTTADEQSRNLQQQFAGIQTQFTSLTARLSALEQTGAEGLGKQKFQDPATAALIEEVRKLSRAQSDSAGVGIGRGEILGAIGVILTLLLGAFVAFRPTRSR